MASHWIGWVFAVASALLFVFKELLDKPREHQKQWIWRFSWMSAAAAAAAVFLLVPESSITSEDVERAAESGSRRAMTAMFDSLKQCNAEVRSAPGGIQKDCGELATRWAAFAQTAFDSAQVAMGLGNFDKALIHLQYAQLSVRGDSAKVSEVYF